MKVRYKKMLYLITMWIMGIGMLTFSFHPASHSNHPNQGSTNNQTDSLEAIAANSNLIATQTPTPESIGEEATVTPTKALASLSDQPEKLILNTDPKLNELIKTYFQAKLDINEDELNYIISSNSKIDIEVLSKVQEYIEDYQNITCYTKPGLIDTDFVVYVAYDMKITTISTLAPAIDRMYVTTVGNEYRICFGYNQDKIDALYAKYDESEDVQQLISDNNKLLYDARQSDSDLNDFITNLTSSLKTEN